MRLTVSVLIVVALCCALTVFPQSRVLAYEGFFDDFFGDIFGDDEYDWFGGYAPEYDPPADSHRSLREGDPSELYISANGTALRGIALAGEEAYLVPLDELAAYFGYTLSGRIQPDTMGGVIPLNVLMTHHGDLSRAALIIGNVEEGIPASCDMYRADGQVQTAEVMVLSGKLFLCAQCAAFGMMIDCDIDVEGGYIRFSDSDSLPPPELGNGVQLVSDFGNNRAI